MTQSTLHDFESAGVECPRCGKGGFDCVGDMKRHHVHAHGESIAGKLVECDNCGEDFRRREDQIRDSRNFCSEDCYSEFCMGWRTGEDNPNYKEPVVLECIECGEEYRRVPSEAEGSKYCSYECKRKWRAKNLRGEDHPAWRGGGVECTCEYCGESYKVKKSHVSSSRFCSTKCYGHWKSENVYGPDHPQWDGGRDLVAYLRRTLGSESWDRLSELARERAEQTCEKCGAKGDNRALHAHHIVPIIHGGSNHPDNIMALCGSCHVEVESYTKSILKDEFKITEFGGESST